ncbi:MAG: indolepyruvate ferredoxin oxidoreductase subunit alpha [Candidatus Hermodarchaeia archaeon]|jgi:indolepyruvate ferredoxin oxidoreductase alpha subunit
MNMAEILTKGAAGKRFLFLGNEAIARGAIEAGLELAATYPGTPSSEIGDSLFRAVKHGNYFFEYCTNEKVAMEVAGAAAVANARSLVIMKHVGLNVASDAFMTLNYIGVRAGLVIVSADDPGCWSSQNEQDNRLYAMLGDTTMLEPADPQEAKDMTIAAFELSEKLEQPVLLRVTTRVSHTRSGVELGPITPPRNNPNFERDPFRFVTVPTVARKRHPILVEKVKKATEISEKSEWNRIIGKGKLGILTSGVSFNYVMEAIDSLQLNAAIFKVGMTYPLPKKQIQQFLASKDTVIVIEELKPYLENHARAFAQEKGIMTPILGKSQGYFSEIGEFTPRTVIEGIAKALGKDIPTSFAEINNKFSESVSEAPPRPPILCAGCPHRATFYEVATATGRKGVYPTDIGCYTLAIQPPLEMADLLLCMGSSIGTSCGLTAVLDKPIVGAIGDSTFFHSGIPGLVNAVYNQHPVKIIVVDNQTTAMTGHQPHPGTGMTGMGVQGAKISIEAVAKGVGVEYVKVINPLKVKESIRAIREAVAYDGPAVIVSRSPCALVEGARKRRANEPIIPYEVDPQTCQGCRVCTDKLGCAAAIWTGEHAAIDADLCTGCGVCFQICPYKAIREVVTNERV